MNTYTLSTDFELPRIPRPIVVIGAGGIVAEAHLPAYRKAGWPIHAIYDVQQEKASRLAAAFEIPTVYRTIDELVRDTPPDAVFDIAVPASKLVGILRQLPHGASVLMQKPMGETLNDAQGILRICEAKHFTASVKFQIDRK